MTTDAAVREAARRSDGRFGTQPLTEAEVHLDVPARPYYGSLDELAAAGYVTDEWSRWQQGGCAAYAVALVDAHPHLRFAVMGRTELGGGDASQGWRETHAFAHDDQYAYDSAGQHPLPYYGIEGGSDYVELDQDPEDWGYRDEFDEEDFAAAREHAARHDIVGRAPVPHGGRVTIKRTTFDPATTAGHRLFHLTRSANLEELVDGGITEGDGRHWKGQRQHAIYLTDAAGIETWALELRRRSGAKSTRFSVLAVDESQLPLESLTRSRFARGSRTDHGYQLALGIRPPGEYVAVDEAFESVPSSSLTYLGDL